VSTRSRIVISGLLAAFVLACLVSVLWRVTREETTDQVAVSADGGHWAPSLEAPVFVSDSPWPPGQTRTAVIWVRNDADVRADVDLHVVSASVDDNLRWVLEVAATVNDEDDAQPFIAERDVNTVRVGPLERGERATVTLRAELSGSEDLDSASVTYRIVGSGTRAEDSRSMLDSTEAHLELAPLFLGLGLLMTAYVMHRSRRPRARSSRRP